MTTNSSFALNIVNPAGLAPWAEAGLSEGTAEAVCGAALESFLSILIGQQSIAADVEPATAPPETTSEFADAPVGERPETALFQTASPLAVAVDVPIARGSVKIAFEKQEGETDETSGPALDTELSDNYSADGPVVVRLPLTAIVVPPQAPAPERTEPTKLCTSALPPTIWSGRAKTVSTRMEVAPQRARPLSCTPAFTALVRAVNGAGVAPAVDAIPATSQAVLPNAVEQPAAQPTPRVPAATPGNVPPQADLSILAEAGKPAIATDADATATPQLRPDHEDRPKAAPAERGSAEPAEDVRTSTRIRGESVQQAPPAAPVSERRERVAPQHSTLAPTRPAAKPAVAEPADIRKAQAAERPSPPRELILQIPSGSKYAVQVHLSIRGDSVRVNVRTSDVQLNTLMRENLNQLVHTVSEQGFRIEAWTPSGTWPGEGSIPAATQSAGAEAGSNGAPSGGPNEGGERNSQHHQRRTALWLQELERKLERE